MTGSTPPLQYGSDMWCRLVASCHTTFGELVGYMDANGRATRCRPSLSRYWKNRGVEDRESELRLCFQIQDMKYFDRET
jgi:hypothetical protein